MAKKGKGLPRKYRQARAAARPAAKAAFPGNKKAFRKDKTIKVTAEDREIYRDIAKESKGGYITDDKGNKIRVKPTETAKERMARDRREARAEVERKLALEDKESRASKSEANMKASREAAVAKQKADRAARYGKPTPTLQQTPATEKPLSRPVKVKKTLGQISKEVTAKPKKAAVKKAAVKPKPSIGGTAGTVAKPKPGLAEQIKKDVAKVNANKPAATKGMTRAERSAANKAAWKSMTPEQRKNWSANKPTAAVKPAPTTASKVPAGAKPVATATMKDGKLTFKLSEKPSKRVTEADLKRNEAKGLEEAKKRVAAKNAALANSAKGKTQTPQAQTAKAQAKPEGKAAAVKKTPKKFAKTRGLVKGGIIGALAVEAGSIAKGSTEKDWKEIQRLENKLAKLKGQAPKYKNMGSNKNPIAAMKADLGNLAANATMGIVGKTRRSRMDELNRMIAKQEKKNTVKGSAKGSVKGSTKTKPLGNYAMSTGKVQTGAGGSTIASDKYVVKKGDTFSGIAKNAGVSLKELRDLNPAIMKRKKYKQGAMIWSGTKVNLPKK
jgi:LysM repeat protein